MLDYGKVAVSVHVEIDIQTTAFKTWKVSSFLYGSLNYCL